MSIWTYKTTGKRGKFKRSFMNKTTVNELHDHEREEQKTRRLASLCCPECGRPLRLGVWTRESIPLACSCGFEISAKSRTAAFRAATRRYGVPRCGRKGYRVKCCDSRTCECQYAVCHIPSAEP